MLVLIFNSVADTMVTVIDAFNFFKNMTSVLRLKDTKEAKDDEDMRSIANLLVDQVYDMFASFLFLLTMS